MATGNLLERLIRSWMAPAPGRDWVLEAEWARIQQTPLKAKALLYAIVLVLISMVVWASVVQIDEITRGEGKVVPSQKLQVVQSYDGGIVEHILVNEGQKVEKGQVIVKVDPTRYLSSLEENKSQYFAMAAKVQRLSALIEEQPLNFPDEIVLNAPVLIENESRLYEANIKELHETLGKIDSRITQKLQDIESYKIELSQYTHSLELLNKEIEVTEPLLKSGAISEVDILKLKRQTVELTGAIRRTEVAIEKSKSAVQEEQSNKEEVKTRQLSEWNSLLNESLAKLASLQESNLGLKDIVEQSDIRSPVNGTVQRLLINTQGGVLSPGSQVAEIIPEDDDLIVEAKILPKDIAFIKKGQSAILKFSAYDYAIYGGVIAEVDLISADTISDKNDNTFYIVRLRTENSNGPSGLAIIPGMITQVDIITGKRTVLGYFLNPILKATSQALTER